MKKGIDLFRRRLNDTVVSEIRGWSEHPSLHKLLDSLEKCTVGQKFLDFCAEAMIARYLLRKAWTVEYEVPTVNGRQADFKATKNGENFFIHIKRVNVDQATQKEINIQSRLEELKKIQRPVLLSILFHRTLMDKEVQKIYKVAKNFVQKGTVGEKKTIEDDSGGVIAECEICCNTSGTETRLIICGDAKCDDFEQRSYKKLSSAYKQFMPEAKNIIMITNPWKEDLLEFKDALMGPNGFWKQNRHPMSNIVGWFNFDMVKDNLDMMVWSRHKEDKIEVFQDLSEILESN